MSVRPMRGSRGVVGTSLCLILAGTGARPNLDGLGVVAFPSGVHTMRLKRLNTPATLS
ncbi:MAG: hypothetical protein OXC63_07955 [Aestuariivita sp.]|nr:hypothetical protein [Aestuariivita sp.]